MAGTDDSVEISRMWPSQIENGARVKATCRSTKGFQSCSQNMTVSAAVRLSPSPQARVVIRRIRKEGEEVEEEEEEEEEEDRPRLLLLFLSSSLSLSSLSFPLLPSSFLWLWLWLSPLNLMAVSDRTLGGTDPSRRAYGTVGKYRRNTHLGVE